MNKTLIIVLLLIPCIIHGIEIKTYSVMGDSMFPLLVSGDKVVVTQSETIQKDDLVAVRFKKTPPPLVKRVVAIEGDKIEFDDNAIIINGGRLRAFDVQRWKSTVSQLRNYNWIIPKGHCFVLGDNPKNSKDSRRLGIISYDQIEGKVVEIIKKISH